MYWRLSHRADKKALPLADRHYNRQKPGTPQFVPPGRCIVLLTENADALWVSSWPFAEYVRHAWAGAWVCTMFRNESGIRSSELITEAIAITRNIWGEPPSIGMITFVDPKIVPGTMVRNVLTWGYSYQKAGFLDEGKWTKGGLFAVRMPPESMPLPMPVIGSQLAFQLAS